MSDIIWTITEDTEDLYLHLDEKYRAFSKYISSIPFEEYPEVIHRAIKGIGSHYAQTGMIFPEDIYESGDEPADLAEAGSEGYENAFMPTADFYKILLAMSQAVFEFKKGKNDMPDTWYEEMTEAIQKLQDFQNSVKWQLFGLNPVFKQPYAILIITKEQWQPLNILFRSLDIAKLPEYNNHLINNIELTFPDLQVCISNEVVEFYGYRSYRDSETKTISLLSKISKKELLAIFLDITEGILQLQKKQNTMSEQWVKEMDTTIDKLKKA